MHKTGNYTAVMMNLKTKMIRMKQTYGLDGKKEKQDPEKFKQFFQFMKVKFVDRDGNPVADEEEIKKHSQLKSEGEEKKEERETEKTVKNATKKQK